MWLWWYQFLVVPIAAAFGGMAWEGVLRRGVSSQRTHTLARLACLTFFGVMAALSCLQLQP